MTAGPNYLLSWLGNPSNKQSLDTTIANSTNGPIMRYPDVPGKWTYRYWVLTTATACNIQPTTFPEQTIPINVESCKPEWWIDHGQNAHPPQGTGDITIVLPSDMGDIIPTLTDAKVDWENGTGRVIHVLLGGTCDNIPAGYCIRLDDGYSGGGCAGTSGEVNLSTGQWVSPTILIKDGWQTSNPSVLRHNLAHEIGHYFGLDDRLNSSCGCTDTTMGTAYGEPGVCNSPDAPPQGCTLGPTASDLRIVAAGPNGNRQVCGW